MQSHEIWQATLGELQTHISQVLFQAHLNGCVLLEYDANNHELVIGCLTNTAQVWIEQWLTSTINRILTGIAGFPLAARFVSLQAQSDSTKTNEAEVSKCSTWSPDWSRMGIPPRFIDESLGTLDWDQAALQNTDLREYVDHALNFWEAGIGLMLVGAVGVGKTHLVIGLGKFAVQQGLSYTFISAASFLEKLWESYNASRSNPWAETEVQIIEHLAQCDLLALDDLRIDGLNPWGRSKFLKLINRRWEYRAPIMITSNFTLNELAYPPNQTGFDAAMLSRLVGSTKRFMLNGDDYRLKSKCQAVNAARGLRGHA